MSQNVNQAPVTATAGSYSGVYNGISHSTTPACAVTADAPNTYKGALTCSNNPASVGKNIGSGTITPVLVFNGETATNFSVTKMNGSWSITQASLTITTNNVTKTYGTTYNFDKTLPSVDFYVGTLLDSDTVTRVTFSSAGAAQWATVAGSPYPISISGAIGSGLGNYNITYVPGSLTVTARPALVRYIGQLSFVTSGTSSTTAQVHLTASMQDPSGTELVGATVNFIDDLSGNVLAANVPVTPVPGAIHTGTADKIVTLSSGQYGAESYVIRVVATGNYDNSAQSEEEKTATVVVSKPAATNQATGGGAILRLPGTAGTYGAKELLIAVFSVGMKYNKGGTNPQGKIVLTIPQTDLSLVYVKSNSISSMAISGTNPKTAVIYTKATIYRIRPDGTQENIDGNVTLRMDIADYSTGADKVGFTVLSSKGSLLYYSSNWLNPDGKGWKTVLQSLLWGALAVQ